jgi:ribosomal protein S18 acetylase RimI-like enzyme
VDAVLDVWRRADAEPTITDDAESVRALLRRDPDALLVVEAGGGLIGTVIAAWNGWRGSVYRLAVVPEHRRRGVARALVGAAERRLTERGARRIDAIVAPSRPDAMAFWAALGFQRQADRTRFIRNVS